mmetsp:Transcript_16778/g.21379  ORF Transcript_16778/g.21379 Transcript_16778/m.21379 type:complete len:83 (+) Transcript_16778:81-329(+)
MGGSYNSRKGVRDESNAPERGSRRTQQTKRRNNKRNRAMKQRVMANFSDNIEWIETDVFHVPAKNAKYANDGCIICGYVARG